MNNSIKDYHRKPTYEELIQEAVINPTDMIKYPNRIATQLRNTQELTRFDDENFLDINTINSNATKQTIQPTAVQKALQPIARQIKTGYEQFDILDTEDTIQQQADDNEAELEESQTAKRKKYEDFLDIFKDALSDPSQIDEIMSSSSSSIRGNLRGSSSSAAAASQEEEDIQERVPHLIGHIELNKLEQQAHKRLNHLLIEIRFNLNNDIRTTEARDIVHEYADIRNTLSSINEFKTKKFKKNRTPEAIDNLTELKNSLTAILNKSQ
jgi:hypothetical protein